MTRSVPLANGEGDSLGAFGSIDRTFYPTGKRGRTPIGILRMLRLYFAQLWYNFSDEGTGRPL